MYELFEHTADLGIRARAPDLTTLFCDAARGLFSAIGESSAGGESEGQRYELRLTADRIDYLFLDWLNELLYLFESRALLLDRFEASIDGTTLRGSARGVEFDPQRDRLYHEVKAITYHDLTVRQEGGEWLAEVIVDI